MGRITLTHVGKKYKRYAKPVHRLLEWASLGRRMCHESIWVLKGITFTVEPGEAVGIIGQNGAGKSTLLKIITGTTLPTEGTVQVQGRVAALLELGMGFHPDFTGRQNVVLAAQIMGLNADEIYRLMPAIEDFAEIGPYMDQPLRTYSSGMAMRLAFSVATAVRPDILIVDEALSVGDAYFQHKCFRRIREFKGQGTTLLFVSHDPGAVKTLCDSAILLDRGVLVQEGDPDVVLDYYNAMIAKRKADDEIRQAESLHGRVSTRSGNRAAEFLEVELLNDTGEPIRAYRVGETMQIRCRIAVHQRLENPTVGILIRDRLGNDVFGTNTYHLGQDFGLCEPGAELTVRFTLPVNLGVGHYNLTVAIHDLDTHLISSYDWWDQAATFQVVRGSEPSFVGLCNLPVTVAVSSVRAKGKDIVMGGL